jgi:hypothetical protein
VSDVKASLVFNRVLTPEEWAEVNRHMAEVRDEFERLTKRLEAAESRAEKAERERDIHERDANDEHRKSAELRTFKRLHESELADAQARAERAEANVANWERKEIQRASCCADNELRAERAEGLLQAILDADERGQGLPFAEAMNAAHEALARIRESIGE